MLYMAILTGPVHLPGLIRNDTIVLDGSPFDRSDGILANKYILSTLTLIPVKYSDTDQSVELKIEK